MSFMYTDAVFSRRWNGEDGLPVLTATEKWVLMALAEHANGEGECFAGYTLLCDDTLLSRGCISETIASLAQKKVITIDREKRKTTTYILNVEPLPKEPDERKAALKAKLNGKKPTRIRPNSQEQSRWERLLADYEEEFGDDPICFDSQEFRHWAETDPEGRAWLEGHEKQHVLNLGGDDDELV